MFVRMSVHVYKGAFYRFTLLSIRTFIDYYNKELCLRLIYWLIIIKNILHYFYRREM